MANSTNFDTPKDNGCCQVPVRTKNCTTFSIILQNVRIPPGLLMLSYHARLKLPALTSKHCAALTPKPPSARTCKPRYPQQIASRGAPQFKSCHPQQIATAAHLGHCAEPYSKSVLQRAQSGPCVEPYSKSALQSAQ